MRQQIIAFQCIFCLEKFDIGPNLEDRLLRHYYSLHAENRLKSEDELHTTSAKDVLNCENIISVMDENSKDSRVNLDEYSNVKEEIEEFVGSLEYKVLSDCSIQCTVCSMVMLNWISYEDHVQKRHCKIDPCDNGYCTVVEHDFPLEIGESEIEYVEYLDEALDFLKLQEKSKSIIDMESLVQPIEYECIEMLDEDDEDVINNISVNQSVISSPEKQKVIPDREKPKKLSNNLIGCVRKIYTDKKYFEKITTNNTSTNNILDEEVDKLIKAANGKKFECSFCNKLFKVRSKLKEHMLYHYPPEHKCPICAKTFYRARNWRYHIKTHEEGFEGEKSSPKPRKIPDLNKCYYGLPNSGDLLKPWKCMSCDKIFAAPNSVKAHYDRHHTVNKRRDYICHICGKNLSNRMALNDHLKVHKGVKEFECDLCGLKFVHKNMVRVHMIRHRTENSYKCEICPATFKSWRSLDYHKKRHSGGGNLACEFCGKKFILSIHLKYHRSMHTGEKHFHCYPCKKGFTRSNNRKKHNKSVHGIALTKIPLNDFKEDINYFT